MSVKLSSVVVVTMILLSVAIFRVVPSTASSTIAVGVKTGDWIRCDYALTGWPAGTPHPEWLKVEFLSVEGTNATVRVTMHMSNGTEQNSTMPVDVVSGGQALGLSGLVIPANLTTGDTVYISGYGNVTIAGETVGSYAKASRTVVHASFSLYGTQLTYYWDKQTGVMVEASTISGTITGTATATETNMWEATEMETIYIRADGSIDPPTAPIQRNGDVYTLTGNITSSIDGIVIERDNIILDGAGHAVQGTNAVASTGIDLTGRSNVTIKNMNIEVFDVGILLYSSSNNNISGNNIAANDWCNIRLDGSSSNSIFENNITASNENGIFLHFSSGNNISENSIANNHDGINLYSSSGNNISNNNITANSDFGITLTNLSNNTISENTFVDDGLVVGGPGNVVADNTVNGKPLVYLEGVSDYAVDYAGQVILVNCNSITVENLNLSHTDIGILLVQTNNTIIQGSNITNNIWGIGLGVSSNNTLSRNNITNNWRGIELDYSAHNKLSGNNIASNAFGIYLLKSSNNTVSRNRITSNNRFDQCIFLDSSSNNSIFHNNLGYIRQPIFSAVSENSWDDGYPSGGNYWSDHNPPDVDKDKIGDLPYEMDENNTDRYPLVFPFECYEPGYLCSPDLTGDGIVNIVDVSKVARSFGCVPGDSNWSPTADLDLNEVINIVDVSKVAKEFGKEWKE